MRLSFRTLGGAVAGIAMVGLIGTAVAANISGAGATFPFPIYAKWGNAYKGESGNGINYQSIGSGGGIAQIKAKTVTFGATDAPLTPKELNQFGLEQFPTVIGGDVPIVNLAGVKPGDLVLDGPTLADIFLGKVANWSDPAIKALNPSLTLPNQAITVVHRSDGSGTTFIFANYLAKVSKQWADDVGYATSIAWPVGVGARGNEGVAGNVAQLSGAIGYVEYTYATQNKLAHARMKNKSGGVVAPTLASFKAAAEHANWHENPGFYVVITDAEGQDVWPISGATFILVHKQPADPKATAEALKFFKWAFAKGDQMAEALDYVPMPDSVVQEIEASWAKNVKSADGQPIM